MWLIVAIANQHRHYAFRFPGDDKAAMGTSDVTDENEPSSHE